ncbi:hypothetical protein [Geomonas propionica]|uniref:Lipoprotein n=1 Tax=Geomonas propionica TaxID=2798582 RepID=A0ABS0YVU3_9BACT|nr:hypothetical protein [Geomonas propionica]MBJ6802039.1 hypothetical protein [Geomonas propionica]
MAMAGCGGGNDRPLIDTTIDSYETADGDILKQGSTFTITMPGGGAGATLLAGVAPDLSGDEYRAFLDFPLTSGVRNGVIQSATLNVVVRNLSTSPAGSSLPLLVELVSYVPPLIAGDFDSAILAIPSRAQTVRTITPAQVNDPGGVDIDVTALLIEAQNQRLSHFQIRLLEDFVNSPLGIVTIDDSNATPPQLRVLYF